MTMIKKSKFLALAMATVMIFSACKNVNTSKDLVVTKWNNFYEGKNIQFYYEDSKNTSIEELNRSYQLNGKVGSSGDELDRATKITQWMKTLMQYDKGSVSTKEDSLSILQEIETSKKASDREFSIVFSQSAASIGLYARRGEFRIKNSASGKGEDYHKVAEVWSEKYKKWIMIDPSYGVYLTRENVPLSAIEVIQKGLEGTAVVGMENSKKYLDKLQKMAYSYSIPIDNNIYSKKKSNTYITYLKSGELPELRVRQGFVPPTIFVNSETLFNIAPTAKYINDKSDKVPTIVIMKKNVEGSINDDKTFVIGVFINSTMLESYQLKINNEPWKKIDMYTDMALNKGENTISLSLNGKDVVREIVITDNR